MFRKVSNYVLAAVGLFLILLPVKYSNAEGYDNFKVAIYSRAYETAEMDDLVWLESFWEELTNQVHVDKIYLETHRDLLIVDENTLNHAKEFFSARNVETAGGITYTVDESNMFETFCYTNPDHRQKVREIAEYTARHFDEIILDDFFFTNCKCENCIEAKGDRSWSEFRLELMTEAASELVINPAKAVNPNVKVVIKYPNWYEHFQGLGFNLETEPALFDGLYTGTETRDPIQSDQHLQQYNGYLIFRYFENLKPGGNGGGWIDTGGIPYMDRYAEQLWITLFAKAPEVTLFDVRQVQRPIRNTDRAEWQDLPTSFDFDAMMKPVETEGGETVMSSTIARAAGVTFEQVDKFIGKLGNPAGIKSYKPYHSVGEEFLHDYLGMIGIPMDLVSTFPSEEQMVFFAETAKFDPEIVEKIKKQLLNGKEVIITSGLLRALQNRGIQDISEIRYSDRKVYSDNFQVGWGGMVESASKILFPQILYLTNDSWENISINNGASGYPLLHSADYAGGTLYILTVPEVFNDLYNLPTPVLNSLRRIFTRNHFVQLEGPSLVSMFEYDNGTFIVESFRPEPIQVRLIIDEQYQGITDLITDEHIIGETPQESPFGGPGPYDGKLIYEIPVNPHSYRVFMGN